MLDEGWLVFLTLLTLRLSHHQQVKVQRLDTHHAAQRGLIFGLLSDLSWMDCHGQTLCLMTKYLQNTLCLALISKYLHTNIAQHRTCWCWYLGQASTVYKHSLLKQLALLQTLVLFGTVSALQDIWGQVKAWGQLLSCNLMVSLFKQHKYQTTSKCSVM